jgi:hypothetical protein
MTRMIVVAGAALLLAACSAVINGSAPKDPSTVYAVGAKQGFFWIWSPKIWECSITPGASQDCKLLEVDE